mgnify:CR=1 FL=1|jgi:hypothetical protein
MMLMMMIRALSNVKHFGNESSIVKKSFESWTATMDDNSLSSLISSNVGTAKVTKLDREKCLTYFLHGGQLEEVRRDGKFHIPRNGRNSRFCLLCSTIVAAKLSRKKFDGRRTKFYCHTCTESLARVCQEDGLIVSLCLLSVDEGPSCFERWHTEVMPLITLPIDAPVRKRHYRKSTPASAPSASHSDIMNDEVHYNSNLHGTANQNVHHEHLVGLPEKHDNHHEEIKHNGHEDLAGLRELGVGQHTMSLSNHDRVPLRIHRDIDIHAQQDHMWEEGTPN